MFYFFFLIFSIYFLTCLQTAYSYYVGSFSSNNKKKQSLSCPPVVMNPSLRQFYLGLTHSQTCVYTVFSNRLMMMVILYQIFRYFFFSYITFEYFVRFGGRCYGENEEHNAHTVSHKTQLNYVLYGY